jgi:hypothetical protein
MKTFLTVLSALLGVVNMFQFLTSIFTGSSMRAKAQSSFNDWYRVAEIADQIAKEPTKAAELIREVNGIANSNRNEIKAYSCEKLNFEPWFDPAHRGGPSHPQPQSLWQKVKSAFIPK